MSDLDIQVDFFGLRQLQDALRRVAPDLAKEMKKTTKVPVSRIYNGARRNVTAANVPSGWKKRNNGPKGWGDPSQRGWDNARVRSGIKLREGKRDRRGITPLWTIRSESAAGNIYEFAREAHEPFSVPFVRKINRLPPSRLVWKAYDDAGGERAILPEIKAAISEIEKQFTERAASIRGGV